MASPASTILGATIAAVAVTVALPCATAGAAAPVLGSRDYVANGSGFGSVAPKMISNGGAPSGVLTRIRWKRWGQETATGRAVASIYRPQGHYYPSVRVPVRASRLGKCPGQAERAYLQLEIRLPLWPGGPLGSWFKWSGSRTLCDYSDTDPAYEYPRLGPGRCKTIGEYGEPGTIQSIQTYRLSCLRARRVAAAVNADDRPFDCIKQGCTVRVRRMKCRLAPVQEDETTGGTIPYPVQRVSCKRKNSNFSAFAVLNYD